MKIDCNRSEPFLGGKRKGTPPPQQLMRADSALEIAWMHDGGLIGLSWCSTRKKWTLEVPH